MATRRLRLGAAVVASVSVLAGCTSTSSTSPRAGGTTSTSVVAGTLPVTTSTTTSTARTSTTLTVTTRSSEEIFCEQPPLEPDAGDLVVTLYQICDDGAGSGNRVLAGLQPVERVIAATEGPLRAAMEALLAGPAREEMAAGFGSWFSSDTAGAVVDASVNNDGLATVDLDGDEIVGLNNVSTSTGGSYFRGQLYGTALSFEEITAVVFMIDGSSSGFCGLMELIPDCVPVSEDQWSDSYAQEMEPAADN